MFPLMNTLYNFILTTLKNPNQVIPKLKGKYNRFVMQVNESSIIGDTNDVFTASNLPSELIDKAIEIFNPTSVLDLGCGTGQAVSYFIEKGVPTVLGVEGSAVVIAQAKCSKFITQFDLNKELNLNRKFDMIFSYEFVEHIHSKHVDILLKNFSNHSNLIVLSAARPGQGGLGHFNEQYSEYWIEKFENEGYNYDVELTQILKAAEKMYPENILVFKRF